MQNPHKIPQTVLTSSLSDIPRHVAAGKELAALGDFKIFDRGLPIVLQSGNKRAQLYHQRLVSKYGKAKALSIIAQKLGRTVYTMLKRRTPYDAKRFFETVG